MKGESAARLRILLLEDNPADAELVLHELRHAGIEADSVRVITRAEFEARLDPCPEAILSDYQLPLWDGLQALRLVRERGLDVPFIIVSGTIGEDLAVEAMRQGADDYLLKDRLSRLGAALIQALERKRLRQEAHEAAQALLERETGLRRAQIMVRLAHVITGLDGTFESWSESLPKLIGVEPAQMPGSTREWRDLIHPEDRALFHTTCVETGKRGVRTSVEYRIRHKDGAWIHVSQVMEPIDAPAEATGRMRWFNTLLDVTEQKRAAEHLRESESVKGAIIETSLDCVVTIDHEGNVVEFNPAAEATFGIRRDQALGKSMVDMLIPPRLRDAHRRGFAHYLATGEGPILGKRLELEAIRADGTEFPIELAITAIGGTSKPMFAGFIRDITARKEAEAKIVRLNRVYAVLSGINALIVRVKARDELFDGACRIAVEAGRFRMSWIGMVERKGMKIEPVASAGAKPEYMAFIKNQFSLAEELPMGNTLTAQAVREKKALFSNDTQNDPRVRFNKEHLESGTRSMAILPLLVADEAVGVLVLHTEEADFFDAAELNLLTELAGDISFALDHIEKAEKLDYLAYYDSLTGLANRSLLLERVAQYMRSAVSGGHKLALFLLDLERFKNINDSLGRPAGDALLKQVAEWLTRNVGDPNLLARVGEGVFAVVVPEVKREGDVARLLEKTMQAFLEHPFPLNDAVFRIAAKVGVALFPGDGANADTLFKNAEAALNKAKASGDRYLFYTQKMTEMAAGRLTLENQLRQALEKEEFVLHYQSKVDSTTGAILGVEALIRWNSAELGLVPPMNFIPLMEETGLILEVGAWALQKAVQDHAQWQKQGLVPPRIAVNVSQIQMHERDFVSTVVHALKQGAVPPGIDLEITESLVMADIRGNIKKLKQIRALGVGIAIDDFGTGYSSLAYLAKLPVQTLKIDRSFIITMLDDPDTMTLVSAIISLAHALRLKVVAEGVDAEDQAKVLRRLRCDEMQGYLFRKPLPIEEITRLLSKAN